MKVRVRIGSLDIEVDDFETLDALVERYGQGVKPSEGTPLVPPGSGNGGQPAGAGGGEPHDRTLLKEFVDNPDQGVPAATVGNMLGTGGRGVPLALGRWAVRVGLSKEAKWESVVETARSKGLRGWRLKAPSLTLARKLVGGSTS